MNALVLLRVSQLNRELENIAYSGIPKSLRDRAKVIRLEFNKEVRSNRYGRNRKIENIILDYNSKLSQMYDEYGQYRGEVDYDGRT